MKTPRFLQRILGLALLALAPAAALAQGTAFTYQGRLDDGGVPANGVYDLRFRLYDAETNGAQVGAQLLVGDLPVTNGLFTVVLDFGSGPFSGNDRWLQIGVRPGASTAPYTILDPLQPLTPAPYAIYAAKADAGALTGTLLDARLSTNVARRTGGNVFSGGQTFTGAFQVTNSNGALRYLGVAPLADGTTLTASLEGAGTNWPRLRFEREAGGTVMDVGQNANGDLMVKASGTERFTVMNNGNVGIGTSTPDERLEVAGRVKATSFVGPLNATNVVGGTLPSAVLSGVALNATNLSSGTMSDARLSTNVALRAGGNIFSGTQVFTNAGASGFSVRNQNGSFNFLGNAGVGDGTRVMANLVGAGTNWPRLRFEREDGGTFMDVGQNANGDLMVKASGTERFTVMNNGNVGIGTTTPDTRLEVAGTVKATSFSGDGSGLTNIGPKGFLEFTNAGTNLWVCPAGVTTISVEMWGGGGGGGGGGAGSASTVVITNSVTVSGTNVWEYLSLGGSGGGSGGAGAFRKAAIPVTPGRTYTLVVGPGGAGGGVESVGQAGGSSSILDGITVLATVAGGSGGVQGTSMTRISNGTGNFSAVENTGGGGGTGAAASSVALTLARAGGGGTGGGAGQGRVGPGGGAYCGDANFGTAPAGGTAFAGSFPVTVASGGSGGFGKRSGTTARAATAGGAGAGGYILLELH